MARWHPPAPSASSQSTQSARWPSTARPGPRPSPPPAKNFKKKTFHQVPTSFPRRLRASSGASFSASFPRKSFFVFFWWLPWKKRHKSFSPDGFPGGFPRCRSAKSVRRGEGCSRRSAQTQTASRPTPTTFSRPSTPFPGAALAETWHWLRVRGKTLPVTRLTLLLLHNHSPNALTWSRSPMRHSAPLRPVLTFTFMLLFTRLRYIQLQNLSVGLGDQLVRFSISWFWNFVSCNFILRRSWTQQSWTWQLTLSWWWSTSLRDLLRFK